MLKRLIPQEHAFFDLFKEAADRAVEAAQVLLKMTQNPNELDPLARELHALEHACDDLAHHGIERLNKTFITPLDREDIHELILKIDDVVDLMHAAANRMVCFRAGPPPTHAVNLAKQIVRGCEKLASAVHGLRSTKNYDAVMRDCIAVHEVENAGDDLLHAALAELFEDSKDPLYVIKWKDIYETLERVTDSCEDVANVIQGVIVKMS
jgi:uncharacterized protein Yka (UPF0111/DUF47 family)